MEDQYLNINESQAKRLRALGFRTFKKTVIKGTSGHVKLVESMLNLSDLLSFFEKETERLEKLKPILTKLENIEDILKEITKNMKQ